MKEEIMSKVSRRDVLLRGALLTTAGPALAALTSSPQGLVPEVEKFGLVTVERWYDEGFYLRGGRTYLDGFEVHHAVNLDDREGWVDRWRHLPPRRNAAGDGVELERLFGKVEIKFDPELAASRQEKHYHGRLRGLRVEWDDLAQRGLLSPEALAKVDEVFAWLENQVGRWSV